MECVQTKADELLLSLISSEKQAQSDVDRLLSVWDIEVEGADTGLLLAIFKQSHPELSFPQFLGPRLDGLIRYFRFLNTSSLARIKPFLDMMENKHIPIMAVGDLAFKLMFPDRPRAMHFLDVGIPDHLFNKAKQFINDDIIRAYPLPESFFSGRYSTLSGSAIQVPSLEQLFYLLLIELTEIIDIIGPCRRLTSLLYDIITLFDLHPKAETIRQCAVNSEKGCELYAAVEYLRELWPTSSFEDYSTGSFSLSQWDKYCIVRRYRNEILKPARRERHKCTFSNLINEPTSILKWLKVRMTFKIKKNVKSVYMMKLFLTD